MTAAYDVLFGGAGPRWFSVPAHRPFLDDLAFALEAAFDGLSPEALADAVVFTPTRRSTRELADAFVKGAEGRAVLLPQIRAIGDLDEGEPPFEPGELALDLPPAITPLRRRFELARLVAAHGHLFARPLDAAAALELADALAAFLDAMQIEEVEDPDRVAGLVEGELARHWRASAEFLQIATRAWPERLDQLGLIDVAARRTRLLRALAAQWRAKPPSRPLVVAGVMSAAPSMADLLAAVAEAERGCVVLPGLDRDLPDAAWDRVADGHPQHELKRMLERAGRTRGEVRPWPTPELMADQVRARDRRRLVNEALRPAETTDDWRGALDRMREEGRAAGVDPIARGLEGLSLVSARNEGEAAAACAVLLREALETPGKTAALITPDPALARRVSAELARWGVEVDSSAGAPLASLSAGVLTGLVAETLAEPLSPPRLLAILKHPRTRLGQGGGLDQARQSLERRGLRGPRPRDWATLLARLQPRAHRLEAGGEAAEREVEDAREGRELAEVLRAALEIAAAPFRDGTAPAAVAARALAEALEALAANRSGRGEDMWAGPDGEAAAELLAGLMQDGAALPDCTPSAFAEVVRSLLAAQVVRSGGRTHPRLRILGLIEGRLVGADRLVLAGLEEGVWPRGGEVDPFLSRPMRARLGLPSPERRVGIAAHDFAQAACAGEVALVSSERRGGQPAVMSRWLWRLSTLARGAGLELPRRDDVLRWARGLDAPLADPPKSLQTAPRPAPRPPLAARPDRFSVTEVEKLVRDPYAIYARRILKLQRLARPDEPIEARARGTAIHRAFEAFAGEWDALAKDDAGARFADLYMQALEAEAAPTALLAREAVLAERAGRWVAQMEMVRRSEAQAVHVELEASMPLDGGVTLTCRADRLELARDGRVHILDFKTGRVPTRKEIETDFAPQLTLTAALLAQGGFAALGPREPGDLVYLRVNGRDPAGSEEVRGRAGESAAMAQAALAGLQALLARYRDPDTPYRSRTAPRFVAEHVSDVDHLARLREWSAADEEEE